MRQTRFLTFIFLAALILCVIVAIYAATRGQFIFMAVGLVMAFVSLAAITVLLRRLKAMVLLSDDNDEE